MGDEATDTFTGFVSENYTALVRYAYALVADKPKAEDLVQSALVKTLGAWPRLCEDGGGVAYTKVVMARSAWRAAKRWWRREVPTEPLPEAPQPLDRFDEVDDADVVKRALRSLPQDQRVVLVLRFLDGLSVAETAERLGCPAGTVKSRTARSLDALRQMHLLDGELPSTPREGD